MGDPTRRRKRAWYAAAVAGLVTVTALASVPASTAAVAVHDTRDGKYRQDSSGCVNGVYGGRRTPAARIKPGTPAPVKVESRDSFIRDDRPQALAADKASDSTSDEASPSTKPASTSKSAAVARQIIVEWNPGATAEQKASALAKVNLTERTTINPNTSGDAPPAELATVEGSRDAALATLKTDVAVLSAEPNRLLHRAKRQTLDLSKCFNDPILLGGDQWYATGRNTEPGNKYGINAAQ